MGGTRALHAGANKCRPCYPAGSSISSAVVPADRIPPNARSGAPVTSPFFGQLSDKLLLALTALPGVSHVERNRGREISIRRAAAFSI
jgi:hypothetical protein